MGPSVLRTVYALLLTAAMVTGCGSGNELSVEDRERLDSLEATGVVRAYFESGDADTELYLSTPDQRKLRSAPNYVEDNERQGGIGALVIEGGASADRTIAGAEGYTELRQFVVQYESRAQNSIGEPPGPRFYFVYTGIEPGSDHTKVLSVGTGP